MHAKLEAVFETIGTLTEQVKALLAEAWQFVQEYIKAHWPGLRARLLRYARLTRLDRPIGIYLLLWPTLWGLWIAAEGKPNWYILLVFCLGVVLMRSAGCVLNDIADRRFDPMVERTRHRPLASGEVKPKEALGLALALILCAFLLVLTLNKLTIQLALVAVALAGIYPFMKRYTYLPQFFLGLAFGWSIPMAFAAHTGSVPRVAWVLLIANVLWSVVYDTMYAMVDREDDLKIGVKSTAILFDDADRVIIGIIQLMVVLTLIMAGKQAGLGISYFIGLFIACGFFIYQMKLIWDRKPEQCFQAFLNNNWFGLTIFLGIMLDYLIR